MLKATTTLMKAVFISVVILALADYFGWSIFREAGGESLISSLIPNP